MIKETADISTHQNWVKTFLETKGMSVFEVEGVYFQDHGISMFMDRRKVDDVSDYYPDKAFSEFDSVTPKSMVEAKIELSNLANANYRLALYDDSKAQVYDMRKNGCDYRTKVLDYERFGRWLEMYHSMDHVKKEYIHQDELPEIDKRLRELGTPWIGNLDGFWYENGEVRCIIEFQTTIKTKVANHSNNYWFKRGDDEGRWRNLRKLRDTVGKPLLVIVWSPRDDDRRVKIKRFNDLTLDGDNRGLDFDEIEVIEKNDLIPLMDSYC